MLVVGLALLASPHLGWCWSRSTFVSRDEIVNAAIVEVLSQRRVGIVTRSPGALTTTHYDVVPYESIERFRAANPSCCQITKFVGDDVAWRPWYVIWSGAAPYNVRVTYDAVYVGSDGQIRRSRQIQNIPITCCAKAAKL